MVADLFEKFPLNDDGGSGSASGESGSASGESGSGFIESGSGMESDTLRALIESVSDTVFCSKTALFVILLFFI